MYGWPTKLMALTDKIGNLILHSAKMDQRPTDPSVSVSWLPLRHNSVFPGRPVLVYTSIYGDSHVLQKGVLLQLFLDLSAEVHGKPVRPVAFGEELVSQEL